MFIGMGIPIPDLANLPGSSRPGGGGAFEYTAIDNSFSMLFDGAQDTRIQTEINVSGVDFSFSCWIKHSGTFQGNYIRLMYHNLATSNMQFGGFLMYHTTGTNLQLWDGINFGSTLSANNWYHLAGVWDNTSKNLKYYLNGTLHLDTTYSGYQVIGRTLEIGDISTGNYSTNYVSWDGHIDEYAYWSATKLGDETIQAIYDTTANNPSKVADLSETPEGAPVAWYRMGD